MTKFEQAFIQCLKDGVYPSPSNINERRGQGRFNRLNGQCTTLRLALMYAFGVQYIRGNSLGHEWDEKTKRYEPQSTTKGTVPEWPYLTEDDGYATGLRKPEIGCRKHE